MTTDTEDQLLTELVDEVFRLAGRFSRAGDDIAAPTQLTAARWVVLGALQDEPATMAQVARRRGLRRQSVRESVDRLERTGLVARAPNPADGRAPLVHLTEAGQRALSSIEPRRRAWVERTPAAPTPSPCAPHCTRSVRSARRCLQPVPIPSPDPTEATPCGQCRWSMNHGVGHHVVRGMSQRSSEKAMTARATRTRDRSGGHRPRRRAVARWRGQRAPGWSLRVLTAAALAVDVVVHAGLAPTFDPIRATFSQGQLFRVEAAAAAVAGALILVRANRATWLLAVLVLAGGLAAVLFYQLVDPGQLGPLPDMYDPQWTTAKAASAVAEALGALFAGTGLVRHRRMRS